MKTINGVSRWINGRYSAGLMGGLFIVVVGFFWLFNFSSLPISNPAIIKISGQKGLLDTRLFYSARDAFAALSHYGEEGRRLYLAFLAADFIFILSYSVAFALLMTRVACSVCGKGSSWLRMNVLPLGIGFFDCVENICILVMLTTYPLNNIAIGTVSGIATLSKWLLTLVTGLCLAGGGMIMLLHRLGCRRCSSPRS